MGRRIIVGYDGSRPAAEAARWAADEAVLRGDQLEIVQCVTGPVLVNPMSGAALADLEGVRAEADEAVAAFAEELVARHPRLEILRYVETGGVEHTLAAEAKDAELLVLGNSGVGRLESWLLGSVAYAMVRTSPCPVVLVPQHVPDHVGRIVVGVDGSSAADAAVDWATDEADRRRCELVVLHAWRYPYGPDLESPAAHDLLRVDAERVLEAAAARSRERGAGPMRTELVEDTAASALIGMAHEADLVVVGSHGHGGLRSAVFGSTAHAVTERMLGPVAVVRAAT